MSKFFIFALSFLSFSISAQRQGYWQQEVQYKMDIEINVKKHCMDGVQEIQYTNHSPDVIDRVFYHLYFNAFQPNSMMDVRSRTLPDPDHRVQDRITNLSEDEVGFHKINWLKQDGRKLDFKVDGTILDARLSKPLQPGETTVLTMKFESQVPLQVRRSGRDNKEGISYSMSQWYPKLCEYDEDGWHPNPYIGREFYGVWGNYEVSIEIDKDYTIAAGGVLQNEPSTQSGNKRTWTFLAENVHDFMWAADPDYVHNVFEREDGVKLHFYYQPGENTTDNWTMLPAILDEAFDFINQNYGQYPYPIYAFIQGGDGGMEYPMGTLITGERSLASLVGVCIHELMHSWYQLVLGTNESLYAWMDEGFTSYSTSIVMNHLKSKGLLPGFEPLPDPLSSSMTGYRNFAKTPSEEALSTHADHFQRNQAYGIAAYVKGSVFLNQLGYIIGDSNLKKTLLDFYNTWKFKHPTDKDFIRIAENNSDMVLDWYREYWVNSTHKIDYQIDTAFSVKNRLTQIDLSRIGKMPMPLDVVITDTEDNTHVYHIPLRIMRGEKEDEKIYNTFHVAEDWPWTHPEYKLEVKIPYNEIKSIQIDPSNRLADIDLTNNRIQVK